MTFPDWRLVDRTAAAGLSADALPGRCAVFFEADRDGHPDLYLGLDGPDRFLRNDGKGHFADATAEAGLGDPGSARSVAIADVNGDGSLGIYDDPAGWTWRREYPVGRDRPGRTTGGDGSVCCSDES